MDYFERIEKVISFIEDNLTNKIYLDEIAAVACFSKYHFHRIFLAIAGETVGDYIRKRRLSIAAQELIFSDKKILEIAVELQFESQATFSRAFKNLFGSAPGNYRKAGKDLVLFTRKPINLIELKRLHRGLTMKPVMKKIEEFTVIGMEKTVTLKTNYLIYQLWQEFAPRIGEIKNRVGSAHFEVSKSCDETDIENFTEDSEFIEVASVKVDKVEDVPEGMTTVTVSGGNYMVFTHKGIAMELKKTYDYIWGKWLPNSEYTVKLDNTFEVYDERFLGPENPDSEVDVYIPIK